MRYRITWEGSAEDLITLAKAHVKDFTANGPNDLANQSAAYHMILMHLTLYKTLESVTIKRDIIMEQWILYKTDAPSLLVKSIITPPLAFTFTTDEGQAMVFDSEESAFAAAGGVDFIGTRPKGRPHK